MKAGSAVRALVGLTACLLALAQSNVGHAAEIASAAIFGSDYQSQAECVVLNGGTGSLNVTVKILIESGEARKTYNCGGPVDAGEFCAATAVIARGKAYACVATAASVAALRGALVIQELTPDGSGGFYWRAIRSSPLR